MEVTVNLEEPSFELVAVAIVKVKLVGVDCSSSGLGSGWGVYCNIAYREGVQSVKSIDQVEVI